MVDKFQYKIIDYVNIDHHNYKDVENFINNLGTQGFELIEVIDMGENNFVQKRLNKTTENNQALIFYIS